jgi:hypothetical protein
MNAHDVRTQLQVILSHHAEALQELRTAHGAMQVAYTMHDSALISAIEANRAALDLLARLLEDGHDPS